MINIIQDISANIQPALPDINNLHSTFIRVVCLFIRQEGILSKQTPVKCCQIMMERSFAES